MTPIFIIEASWFNSLLGGAPHLRVLVGSAHRFEPFLGAIDFRLLFRESNSASLSLGIFRHQGCAAILGYISMIRSSVP